jgi:hypothetical protein
MSRRKKLDAFVLYTKKIFVKKKKRTKKAKGQLSLFEEGVDAEKDRRDMFIPVYAWRRK